MTADEAASVIALWQQEQTERTGLTDKPAVPDVAEGLDITVDDVQRLLEAVRTQRLEEERALAQEVELSEVRLSEEARQLAEIQRQRAELRREQAEAERRMGSVLEYQPEPYTRPSLYTKNNSGNINSIIAYVVLGLGLLVFAFSSVHLAPSEQTQSPHIFLTNIVSHIEATGQVKLDHVTCIQGEQEVPCDDATIAEEQKSLQREHDQKVAESKKKTYDHTR